MAYVITDSEIAAYEFHVTDLPFACVRKDAVRAGPVAISVLVATFSGKKENERRRCWSRDAALALTSIHFMDIADSIVDTTGVKGWNVGYLLAGAFYFEAELSQSASSRMFSATEFLRRQRGAAGNVFVRNTCNCLAVISLTIMDENIFTRLSESVDTQEGVSSNSIEFSDRQAHCVRC